MGSGGIVPCILNLSTRWRWSVSFTLPAALSRGSNSRYPLGRRLGGSQSRSGRGGEEKNSHHRPCRESNPGRPVHMSYPSHNRCVLQYEATFQRPSVHVPVRKDSDTNRATEPMPSVSLGSSVNLVTRQGAPRPGFDYRQGH
jgi:hypothetical protein